MAGEDFTGKQTRHLAFLALSLLLAIGLFITAVPLFAQDAPPETTEGDPRPDDCGACHLNIEARWHDSAHAHAYDDPVFQEWWAGQGKPGDCLLCHTTGFNPATGEFTAEGITCQACHGEVNPNHPPEAIPIRGDTEYCGTCHTPTLSEWRLSSHGNMGVGCVSCHDPHDQLALFNVPDDMCINCHQDSMEDYLEDIHIQEGVGCVDCHMLVIPPQEMPIDGLVPTGHQFTITPATCIACHTDALHSGYSLPGWERGATAVRREITPTLTLETRLTSVVSENGVNLQQQVQALEAALASRTMSVLFQGGVVGLVLGGSTAWIVAHNVRRRITEHEDDAEEDHDDHATGEE